MMEIYIQIVGKYQYLPLSGPATEENPDVILIDNSLLEQIGITEKFDLKTKTIVPMTAEEMRIHPIKDRMQQIQNKLVAQDYIHVRQQRETTLRDKGVLQEITMNDAEYFAFCKKQNDIITELRELEAELEELTVFVRE